MWSVPAADEMGGDASRFANTLTLSGSVTAGAARKRRKCHWYHDAYDFGRPIDPPPPDRSYHNRPLRFTAALPLALCKPSWSDHDLKLSPSDPARVRDTGNCYTFTFGSTQTDLHDTWRPEGLELKKLARTKSIHVAGSQR